MANEPDVYWLALIDRHVQGEAVQALMNVAANCAVHGARHFQMSSRSTDQARNEFVSRFLESGTHPDDVMVMLDNDHIHPANIVQLLAAYPFDVMAALAYRRGGYHDPLIFLKSSSGNWRGIDGWRGEGVIECDAVATCAIAIKRRTFDKLKAAGFEPPYFRYTYEDDHDNRISSEDIYFCDLLHQAGIKCYVDTRIITPHLFTTVADGTQFRRHKETVKFIEQGPGREGFPDVIKEVEAKVGVEVGVQAGEFSRFILDNWSGTLHLVDPWEYQNVGYRDTANVLQPEQDALFEQVNAMAAKYGSRCIVHREYSPGAADLFEDGELDFVYIDGNHSFEATLADLKAWYPKVRTGGVIAGDNFVDNRHVDFPVGVRRAVLEFMHNREKTIYAEPVTWPRLWYFVK